MTFFSAFAEQRQAKRPARAASWFPAAPQRSGASSARVHAWPANPGSIPVNTLPQRGLTISAANHPLEAEADAMASRVTGDPAQHRASGAALPSVHAPHSVHQALAAPGQLLDPETRAFMEPRLGRDLGDVRVHTGPEANEAARSVEAQAYTVGQDIFFGSGRYHPHSSEGRRLLAHELSHTVQQSGGGRGFSSAAPAVQRDPDPKAAPQGTSASNDTKQPQTRQITIFVPPNYLQPLQLTPPSLLAPQQQPSIFSPGTYSLGGTGSGLSPGSTGLGPSISPTTPSLFPPPIYTPPAPGPLAPTSGQPLPAAPQQGGQPAAAPKAPDRVSFHDFGRLSIGARIGFPDLSKDTKPGDPPSALQESIKKTEVLNFMFTGQKPSEYSVDPGKLVGSIWGILTEIAPDATKKIAAGLGSKAATAGPSLQVDATILLNLSGPKPGGGGGATLTVTF